MSENPLTYSGGSSEAATAAASPSPPAGKSSALDQTIATLQKPAVKHGLLSTSLLVLAIAAGNYLNFQGERIARRWTDGLRYASRVEQTSTQEQTNLRLYLEGFPTSTPAERHRLEAQLGQIQRRARAYAQISIFYYTRLFSAIALASTTGIVAAVCLFYISKVGWEDADNYVVNVFVVASGITVLVGAFPVVFQQENNVQKNAQLYMSYIDLENQVLTALATRKNEQGEAIDLSTILIRIDRELAALNTNSIGFSAESIPRTQDIFKQLAE